MYMWASLDYNWQVQMFNYNLILQYTLNLL